MIKREIQVRHIHSGEIVDSVDVTMWTELDIVKHQDILSESGEYPVVDYQIDLINIEVEEIQKDGYIVLPVQFSGFTPLKDKSYNLKFNTNPPSDENILKINRLHQNVGVMIFKTAETPNNEDFEMLDKVEETFEKTKSQSQRIYNVLFVLWQEQSEGYEKFKDYYQFKTEQMITHFKGKLNPR